MAERKKKNSAEDAAKKALETAAATKVGGKKKIQHTYTQVGQETTTTEELLGATKKNALPYRIFAFVLWIVAIGFEVMAILFFTHTLEFSFTTENPGWTISWAVSLGLDLICVIIGSLLWKKGNHLDPAPKKNKFRFWVQNNLGVIISVIAFAPFIIFALTDKKANKQSKIIAVVAAAIALVIAGLFSYDWNPLSQEEMLENAHIDTVYWTASGTVYHAYDDCGHLNHTVELFTGTSQTAIENGKTRLCKTCEARAAKEAELAIDTSDKGDDTAPAVAQTAED